MDTESTGKGFGLDKKKLFFSFGSAAVGIAAAALFESERERRSLIVRRYELRSPKIERPRRIVYLSDFHERRLGDIAARLLKETERLRPDYIFLGGDMVTAKHGASIQATLALTERLPRKSRRSTTARETTRRGWTATAGAICSCSTTCRRGLVGRAYTTSRMRLCCSAMTLRSRGSISPRIFTGERRMMR